MLGGWPMITPGHHRSSTHFVELEAGLRDSNFRPDARRATPLIRLAVGFISVLGAVVVAQLLITALPVSRLLQNILLGLFTPPVAIGTYRAFGRYFEQRRLIELEPKPAAGRSYLGCYWVSCSLAP